MLISCLYIALLNLSPLQGSLEGYDDTSLQTLWKPIML